MRVHDTTTGYLQDRKPSESYAILSHTWHGSRSTTFQEVEQIQESTRSRLAWRRVLHWALIISFLLCILIDAVCIYYWGLPLDSDDAGTQYGRIRVFPIGITFIALALLAWLLWLEATAYNSLKQHAMLNNSRLSEKIRKVCTIARDNGFTQVWVDMSCIDRTNSSELSQAINSMFAWYRDAAVCYVYLPDVPSSVDHRRPGSAFRYSHWFTRGWTLQELLAPREVVFLSREWEVIGTKESLADIIMEITGINYDVLMNRKPLSEVSVATRMSWTAERSTKFPEDQAYCLLGIFEIFMTPIYGEGLNAFRRLQQEILSHIPDDSIFAWESHVFKTPHMSSPQASLLSSGATTPRTHLMRLLDTATGHFVDRPENSETPYTVISHTWDDDEVKYEDILEIQRNAGGCLSHTWRAVVRWFPSAPLFFLQPFASAVDHALIGIGLIFSLRDLVAQFGSALKLWPVSILNNPRLSTKIRKACAVAHKAGYTQMWIDVGCVDHGNRAELTRTVASVYSWFSEAAVCYAYLVDVPSSDDPHATNSKFRSSRWFMRSWTLQELLAPREVIFFSREWKEIGTKETLAHIIADITGIRRNVLISPSSRFLFDEVSVAERISWASRRSTSFVEDRAYCLLGILDITMATQYGEGEWAFRRLREKIRQRYPQETSLQDLAWPALHQITSARPGQGNVPGNTSQQYNGRSYTLLAPSPRAFRFSRNVRSIPGSMVFHDNRHTSDNPIRTRRRQYRQSPYGVCTDVHLTVLPKSTSSVDMDAGADISPQWYLVILSCEDSSFQERDHLLARLCYSLPQHGSSDIILHVGEFFGQSSSALAALAMDWHQQESLVRVPKPRNFASAPLTLPTVESIYIPHMQYPPNFGLQTNWFGEKPPRATTIMFGPSAKVVLHSWGYDIKPTKYNTPQTPDTISLLSVSIPFILRLKKVEHEAAIFLPIRPHPYYGYSSGWIVNDDGNSEGILSCGVVTSTHSSFASLVGTGRPQTAQKSLLEDLKRYCASQNEWNTGTEIVRPILVCIADGQYDLRFDIVQVPGQVPVN